jgi:hypothetical protein
MDEWVDRVLDEAAEAVKARGSLSVADRASIADILDKYLFDSMVLTVGEIDYLAINADALTDTQWDMIYYILMGREPET